VLNVIMLKRMTENHAGITER